MKNRFCRLSPALKFPPPFVSALRRKLHYGGDFFAFRPVNAPLVCGRRRRGAGPEPVLSGGGRFLMPQKYLEPPGFRYFCVETARENCKGPSPRLLFTNFVTKSVLIQYNIRLKPIFFRYNTHEVICYGREIYTAIGRRCRR